MERASGFDPATKRRGVTSHAHVQIARELGMNPRTLGKADNHEQEPWKLPLPAFIEHLYFKRFGKRRPNVVVSTEERARIEQDRKGSTCAMGHRRAGGDAQG